MFTLNIVKLKKNKSEVHKNIITAMMLNINCYYNILYILICS